MRKLVLLAHVSMDGFVSAADGGLAAFEPGEENLRFVCELTRKADAALFGRKSFDLLESFWPNAAQKPGATSGESDYCGWYNRTTKIVFSRTLQPGGRKDLVILRDNIAAEVRRIKAQPGGEILIFGSPSVTQVLARENLIDTYWLFINPALFGSGTPLFTESAGVSKFTLRATHPFANGEVALQYVR
jgi:dihydrofolate reductase